MSEITYGIVFKDNSIVYLTEYEGNHNFTDGTPISDEEKIYDDLRPDQMSFVRLITKETGEVTIKDLHTITISHEIKECVLATEILLDLECREGLATSIEEVIEEERKNE